MTATPTLPIGNLRQRASNHLRQVLGVPDALSPADLDGTPLATTAQVLDDLTRLRFRLLDRARVGADTLTGQIAVYAAAAGEGVTPWPLSADHLAVLARLDGQVAMLDQVLTRLAVALLSAAADAGLHAPQPPQLPPVVQVDAQALAQWLANGGAQDHGVDVDNGRWSPTARGLAELVECICDARPTGWTYAAPAVGVHVLRVQDAVAFAVALDGGGRITTLPQEDRDLRGIDGDLAGAVTAVQHVAALLNTQAAACVRALRR